MLEDNKTTYLRSVNEAYEFLQNVPNRDPFPPIAMPVNDMTDIAFSGYNKTKLMLSSIVNGFDDNRWITSNQLAEKFPDLSIPDGTKATNILISAKNYYGIDDNGEKAPISKEEFNARRQETIENGEKANAFYEFVHTPYSVFNASQIPNYPLNQNANVPTQETVHELVNNFVASSGVQVKLHDEPISTYDIESDTILMSSSLAQDKNTYCAKLLEGFFYATAHENREDRNLETSNDAVLDSLKAKMFTFMACSHLGLEQSQEYAEQLVSMLQKSEYGADYLMRASYDGGKILSTLEQFCSGDTVQAPWFPPQSEWVQRIQDAEQARSTVQNAPTADATQQVFPNETQAPLTAQYIEPKTDKKTSQIDVEHNTSHVLVFRIYLDVPKETKDEAKALGAQWDNFEKSWFTVSNNPNNDQLFAKWQENDSIQKNRIYLAVPKEEKDEAKNLGAKWDSTQKSWYTQSDNPNNGALLAKWSTDSQTAKQIMQQEEKQGKQQTKKEAKQEAKQQGEKIYLAVPKEEKDLAKMLGVKWDSNQKSWFTMSENPKNEHVFSMWAKQEMQAKQSEKIYLAVPKEQKDEAKALGAKWDGNQKSWFTTTDNALNSALFAKWSVVPEKQSTVAYQQFYLSVPKEEKETAKALGAKWDAKAVSWYTTQNNPQNETLFSLYSQKKNTAFTPEQVTQSREMLSNTSFLNKLDSIDNHNKFHSAIAQSQQNTQTTRHAM